MLGFEAQLARGSDHAVILTTAQLEDAEIRLGGLAEHFWSLQSTVDGSVGTGLQRGGAEQAVADAHFSELKLRLGAASSRLHEVIERHAVVAQGWQGGGPLPAPSNVNATPNGDGCVAVGFDPIPEADAYVVRWNRVLVEGSQGDPYGGALVVEQPPATIPGLLNETLYTFSCAAVADDMGEGPSSLPVGCVPTARLPQAPRCLTVSTSASRIAMVRFKEPRHKGSGETAIHEFTVQWSGASAPHRWSDQGVGTPSRILGLARKGQVSAEASPIMVELPMSGEFRFVCRARNGHGYGAESNHVVVAVPPARSPSVSPVMEPRAMDELLPYMDRIPKIEQRPREGDAAHGGMEEGMLGSFPI